jgi:hypothetical protein
MRFNVGQVGELRLWREGKKNIPRLDVVGFVQSVIMMCYYVQDGEKVLGESISSAASS